MAQQKEPDKYLPNYDLLGDRELCEIAEAFCFYQLKVLYKFPHLVNSKSYFW